MIPAHLQLLLKVSLLRKGVALRLCGAIIVSTKHMATWEGSCIPWGRHKYLR